MGMDQIKFDDLVRLPVLPQYENSYRKVTGMTLKLVAPVEFNQRQNFGEFENLFCSLVTRTPAGCAERGGKQTQLRPAFH
jgi:hypothetical protein